MADAPVTPAADTPAASSPVETSAAAIAPSPAATIETPAVAPSLLETFDANKAADKPAEPVAEKVADPAPEPIAEKVAETPKPEDLAPKAEEPPVPKADEPAAVELAPIEYVEHIKLPESLTLDDTTKVDLYGALDAFRADPTLGAQELVNLHEREMTKYANDLVRKQYETWNETRTGWQKDVMSDPEIGGAGHHTAMVEIARVRDIAVPEKERAAFSEFLSVTGAGDHPAFLKMMHTLGRYLNEGGIPPSNITPPADLGGGQNRRSVLYNHPRSNPNR